MKFLVVACFYFSYSLLLASSYKCPEHLMVHTASVEYSGVRYEITHLGSSGFSITPNQEMIDSNLISSPIIQTINKKWNQQEFQKSRQPLSLGLLIDRSGFENPGLPRVLDMPIKFPATAARIPTEFLQLKEFIQRAFNFEASVNPKFDEYFAYITVDQKYINRGESQRVAGPHVDGIQGQAYHDKIETDHSYLAASREPTVFYTHAFDLSQYDVNRHDFNRIFAAQARRDQTYQPRPFEIAMMDAFTVHESPIVLNAGPRTIVRLEFSKKIYNRLGNSHNRLFDYQWNMIPRPVPVELE